MIHDRQALKTAYRKLFLSRKGAVKFTNEELASLITLLEPIALKDNVVIPFLIIDLMRSLSDYEKLDTVERLIHLYDRNLEVIPKRVDDKTKLELVERLAKSIGREVI